MRHDTALLLLLLLLLVLRPSSVRSAKPNTAEYAPHDDAAARLECAETPALPKQPYDVTPKESAKKLVVSDDGTRQRIAPAGSSVEAEASLSFLRLTILLTTDNETKINRRSKMGGPMQI